MVSEQTRAIKHQTFVEAARALGATRARVLRHATSGDINGDYSSVVGYGAAVLWKES